ncbi:hypothetical protein [Pseudomonas sp. HY2-MNA-CIBAN-0224]|uniref:hypothetical protein n=1 Tax=Pseudomonas sp. HY2-MNA-CIBAN-0224 TaxID=3140471 RepID=UPI00331ABA85
MKTSWKPSSQCQALMQAGPVIMEPLDLFSFCRGPACAFAALSHEAHDVGCYAASPTGFELLHGFAFGTKLVLVAHLLTLRLVSRQALLRRPASETSFRNPDWLLVDDRYRTSVCDCYPSRQAWVEICEARVRFEIDDFPRSIAKPEINHVAYLYFTSALCWHLHFSRLFSQCSLSPSCISEKFGKSLSPAAGLSACCPAG